MVALSVERKACDREIACVQLLASAWWWHYTKHQGAPGQMTWLKDPPPWLRPIPSPAYYLASVILWTENKNVTISGRFICFILTVKWRWWPVLWGRQLKNVVNFFEEKSASGWPGWRIFWPRKDLAPLLRWRRHCSWWDMLRSIIGQVIHTQAV